MSSVSIVITSAYEPQTIGRAVKAILDQDSPEILEILVVCPDRQTAEAAKKAGESSKKLKIVKDPGQGKPTALNLAIRQVVGEILVLTDGDVYIGWPALKNLLTLFKNPKNGGVCGRPVPTNPKDSMFGFWAHFLTEAAHKLREQLSKKNQFIELSGYLLAVKKEILEPARSAGGPIPSQTLADDSFISHLIAKKNFKTAYAPKALVFVQYPTTLSDWFAQKKRSAFEYWQKKYSSGQTMRSPAKEALLGAKLALTYPKNLKELLWLAGLFTARTFLWLKILAVSLIPKAKKNLWTQVKSTKA